MVQTKSTTEKYVNLCNSMPDFLEGYFFTGLSEKSPATRLNYAIDIKTFFEFAISYYSYFPDKEPKELTIQDLQMITAKDINLYLSIMNDKGLAEKTRARRKSSISSLYNYLINTERILDYNPVLGASQVKIHKKDYVIYLTESEQEILLQGIRSGSGLTKRELLLHSRYVKRDIAIVFLFLDLGLRVSELHGLDIKDVDLDNYSLIVTRKGGNHQKLFFSDVSKEYLMDYLESRKLTSTKDDPLFVTTSGNRLSIRGIQEMLKKYVDANLPNKSNISVHKLRSSFAMGYYREVNDILSLQRQMGHSSIESTNVYAKASDAELRNNRNWRK